MAWIFEWTAGECPEIQGKGTLISVSFIEDKSIYGLRLLRVRANQNVLACVGKDDSDGHLNIFVEVHENVIWLNYNLTQV